MADWEESQSYLAFVASSYSFNSKDRDVAYKLLEKHEQGKTWSSEELEKMKSLLNRRRTQVGAWEPSYREYEA
ncbi:MAG: hypothetical protein ACTSP4_07520 [Candidatus Hodarchaeales archaeon]